MSPSLAQIGRERMVWISKGEVARQAVGCKKAGERWEWMVFAASTLATLFEERR